MSLQQPGTGGNSQQPAIQQNANPVCQQLSLIEIMGYQYNSTTKTLMNQL